MFTASEEGFYQVTVSDLSRSTQGGLYKKLTDKETVASATSSSQLSLDCYLEKDEKIYLKTYTESSYDQENASISVTKKSGKPVPVTAEGASVTVAANAEQWFSYTATDAARYAFKFAQTGTNDITAALYRDLNDASCQYSADFDKNLTYDCYISAGETVYWKVQNNNNAETTVTVNAEKLSVDADGLAVGTEKTIELPANTIQLISFTATNEGLYNFKFNNTSGWAYLELYDDLKDQNCKKSSNNLEYFMEEGKTVYLKLQNNNADSFTGTLNVAQVNIPELGYGGGPITLSNHRGLAKYTAPSDGIYTFAHNKDKSEDKNASGYLKLYTDINGDSVQEVYYSSSLTEKICYPLTAGTTVYLEVNGNDNPEGDVSIDIEQIASVEKLLTNQVNYLNLSAGEGKWICFETDDNQARDWYVNASWDKNSEVKFEYPDYNNYASTWMNDYMNTMYSYSPLCNWEVHRDDNLIFMRLTADEDITMMFQVSDLPQ